MSGSNLNITRDSCNLDKNTEHRSSVVENALVDDMSAEKARGENTALADNLKQQLSNVLERIEDRTKFREMNEPQQLKGGGVDVELVGIDVHDGIAQVYEID